MMARMELTKDRGGTRIAKRAVMPAPMVVRMAVVMGSGLLALPVPWLFWFRRLLINTISLVRRSAL